MLSEKIICLLLFITLNVMGQDFNFKKFGQKEGIVNTSVKSIFQDSYGFIWFATQGGGISRFDGKNFTTYSKQDGLVGNDVLNITEDKHHNIWISTMDGVSLFNRKTFTNYTTDNGLKENRVYHVLCDNNKIWISTFGGGVCILENGKFSYLNKDNGLSSNKIFSVFKDKKNKYWIGTSKGGINIYNGSVITVIKEAKNFNSASAFCFFESNDGKLWIGTPGRGVFYVENTIFHQLSVPEIATDYISQISEDKNHNIWAATDGHGLLKIKKDLSAQFYNKSNGLSGLDISAVICNYEGEIWTSCFGYGVHKLTNEALSVYTKNHNLSENKVTAFCKKGKGILVNSSNGLNYYKDDSISSVLLPNDLNGIVITDINYADDHLYIGTENKGLFVLTETQNNSFKLIKQINHIDSIELKSTITSIKIDKNVIWVCFYGTGILKITDDKLQLLSADNHLLPTNDVICMYLKNTDLWVGTIGKGLLNINTNTFKIKELNKNVGITSNNIYSINELKNNIVVGTIDEGLFIDKDGKFINYTKKNGLTSNSINAIKTSNDSVIWLGTDLGINKLTLNADYSVKNIKSFNDEDGLKSMAIEQNAIIEFDHKLFFGTGAGLVSYNPKEDISFNTRPKIIITDVLLKYAAIDTTLIKFKEMSKLGLAVEPIFNYKQNDITFKFKALSTLTNHYQFLLDGYENNWSPLQTNNEAIFTNLPHGKYIFKLKAINKYGIESEITEYAFEITPPFYLRWWFFMLSLVAITTSILSFIKYRTQKLIKEKQVLENKVEERTVELKQSNSSLNNAIDEIKDSINYAERIQSSILPNLTFIKEKLPDSFILYKPRDVVSGDFYWFNKVGDLIIFACVDCTGHGVPGAFMSMIGNSLLNEIVLTKKIVNPSLILSNLNKSIFKILKQNTTESKDGMDMALCVIDAKANTLTYSGANRELLLIRDNTLIEYKPTKSAIGGFTDSDTVFNETEIAICSNDLFYMTTDGYADQFGGPRGKKLMTKALKEFLLSIHQLPMAEQQKLLNAKIINWMDTKHAQVDDILVIGMKF